MTERALIVGAAPRPGAMEFYRELLAGFERVIACDAAAEWCVSLGRVPDVAIGDFDSASPGASDRLRAAGVTLFEFPRDKDETDLDLAAAHAGTMGVAAVVFTAAFSGRLDHTLAALGTMRTNAHLQPTALEPDFIAWLLAEDSRTDVVVDAPAGATVSIVPLERVCGLCVRGAKYGAENLEADPLSGKTISNESIGGPIQVTLRSGSALVMLLRSLHNTL